MSELTTLEARIIQRVAELPDRSSPDDWPEAMLVTSEELRGILADELNALRVPPELTNLRERIERLPAYETSVIGQMLLTSRLGGGWILRAEVLDILTAAAPVLPSVSEPDPRAEVARLQAEIARLTQDGIWPHEGRGLEHDKALARQLRTNSIEANDVLSRAGVDGTNAERPLNLSERITLLVERAEAAEASLTQQAQQIATLKEFAQHKGNCPKGMGILLVGASEAAQIAECTCGLDAILRAATEPK